MPTILLFHTGKPVLKFNSSVSLDDMRTFIKNNTGMIFICFTSDGVGVEIVIRSVELMI